MALGTSVNKIFLSVADGKIVQRVPEGTPGAVSRAKKDGKIVHEMRYAYITGMLVNIGIRKSEYQGTEIKEWVFDINDGESNYQVQMMYDSRYATSLLFALANPVIDFNQPLTITPWMKVVNDKKKTSCYLKQGETAIDWFFTRENPNGMPELSKVMYKGKETWDSYDRMVFLEKYILDNVKPKLNNPFVAAPAPAANVVPRTADPDFLGAGAGDDDDLPF
jgi:hypothetical protein